MGAYRDAFGKVVKDAQFIREAEAARLIVKIASGEEVTARVNRICGNPKPIIDEATALPRSMPEQPAAAIRRRLDFVREFRACSARMLLLGIFRNAAIRA